MTNGPSFLPDDYVRDARERRSSIFALALFGVVMCAVFAAFLVTNRQWSDVRASQAAVNSSTEQAAQEITEMKSLEAMREQMIEKAELARGLLEPVPRSVLLASLVNTMPENLSLLELELKSEEIKVARPAGNGKADPKVRRTSAQAKEPEVAAKPEPVKRRVVVNATGVAPDDLDVSRWMGELSRIPFFSGIRLEVSEEKEVRGKDMRQFRISLRIEPGAAVRGWEGLASLKAPVDPLDHGILKESVGGIAPSTATANAALDATSKTEHGAADNAAHSETETANASPALLPEGEED